MDKETLEKIKIAYEKVHSANSDLYEIWVEDIVFSWEWWVGLGLIVVPWVCLFIFRKRNSMDRILYSGFIVLIISSWLDFVGTALGLWFYPLKVIPTIPSYVVWDFTILPVIAMFLLQFRPQMHPIIKACLFGGFCSFVGEPLFEWMSFYVPLKWSHMYSFPIYGLIYLFAHYLSRRRNFEPL